MELGVIQNREGISRFLVRSREGDNLWQIFGKLDADYPVREK